MRVLKEPKNSLVKQYQTLMKLDSVELDITDEALHAIAKKTIALKSGARGLRSVMGSRSSASCTRSPATQPSSK